VIEALQGNVKALKHCALVCRAWLRPSRTNFLRNFTIYKPSQYDGFFALLDADPTLKDAVRTIIAWNCTLVLIELVPRLPNLTTLLLGDLVWCASDVEAHRLLRFPASLTHLSLNGCYFDSCTAFAALLASVPALRSLECDWLTCDFSEEDAAAGEALFAKPVVLTELTMKEIRNYDMRAATILTLGRILRPRKLTLDTGNVLFFEAVLKHSGSFLTDLHATLLLLSKPPCAFQESSPS
jgi:hypothetical protein